MSSILQTKEWAEFKKTQGFEILTLGNLFIHKRKLPFGQNFLYLPEVNAQNISGAQIEELKKITKEQKAIFARLELIDRFSENSFKLLLSLGFQKAFEEIQPKWRQIIDLTKTRGTILAEMKSKGRYNLRLAERKGVAIQNLNIKSQSFVPNLKIFYSLYKQTTEREKISGRSRQYFLDLVDSFDSAKRRSESTLSEVERVDKFKETDYLEIYIARYENEPVAAALVSFYGGVASYLYGGSSRRHKEVMAPYLMHWQIICDAKEREMKIYDLLGRSRPGDEKSKWSGITRFKEQLGGEAVEILGSYDFVNKPFFYKVFKIVEKIRRKND